MPNIKKKYDYGALIFILTFNLVVVSGLRAEQVLELARERLSTILMGFAICIFISLLVFPIWASDELHDSLISRFEDLARSLEGMIFFNCTMHSTYLYLIILIFESTSHYGAQGLESRPEGGGRGGGSGP